MRQQQDEQERFSICGRQAAVVHFVEGFPETDRAGGMTGDKVCKYGLIRVIIGSGDGFQNLFHHSGVDFLVFQVV